MRWWDTMRNTLDRLTTADPVRILSPADGSRVPHSVVVRGVSTPGALVQLFVLAADNQWYLQAPVVRDARRPYRWTGRVFFGTPASRAGQRYELVALVPQEPITASPVGDLPIWRDPWARVHVLREDFNPDEPTGFDNPRPTGDGSLGDPQPR